ncbi:dTDP-4-dehydrorhamnose 3,5-epimerase family protein [Actinophytocola xanthii]|uniref:dTDP-4-dehydrorhamnose 3,5-epimerase n=1 Tax=Actinophytocola xanthii TaxID=1912961 RepID=A0A1Q8CS74_9PSEU|nr:dTDP-4-dehydrorhamnose 3,5-epimerase family protein [Actinophytocola xanthii]OLF17183.1 dTDP-4-dehydrorhamnose 3,5-epimerase [Actinophytocola xanthii]
MRVRPLRIEGAFEFTPERFPDSRGYFTSPFQEEAFAAAVGRPLFPVRQASHNLSRRPGVLRGIHYTATPPGGAKYVYCPRGKVIDFQVDLRVGSPTFGMSDSVVLDEAEGRSVYCPVGVGHGSVVLEADSMVVYLLSQVYVAANELAVSPLDPALALPLPPGLEPLMSERDAAALTLAESRERGMLPDYATCLELDRAPAFV